MRYTLGMVFVAVDKDGNEICAVPSGKKGLGNRDPMTMDTVFWIASCTKYVIAIAFGVSECLTDCSRLLATMACMQACEQGKLSLDDAEQVKKLCPELKDVKVLKDDGTLEDRKTDITLRMLLSHMSGFGYELCVHQWSCWNPR
jgi:CubicO group peptidase (beta-lactamase class C family)